MKTFTLKTWARRKLALSSWAYVFMLAFVSPMIAFAVANDGGDITLKDGSIRPNPGSPLARDPNLFANLAEAVVPSVVNILSRSEPRSTLDPQQNFFRRRLERQYGIEGDPFGNRYDDRIRQQRVALGSGVIIESSTSRALVLTNLHVIEGADTIEIQPDKSAGIAKPLAGRRIGADRELDLALIEISTPRKLPALALGNSNTLRVGDYVMAVGNPFGQGHSVSHGIVSAKERNAPSLLGHYLQTDAPINPGNSGGPLVNLNGEIIGINNAVLAAAQGIGFAIPSNEVKKVVAELREFGRVRRAFLGVEVGDLSDYFAPNLPGSRSDVELGFSASQPLIVNVRADSPAASSGLRPRDVLLEFNGAKIETAKDFLMAVSAAPIGSLARLGIWRDGKRLNIEVRLRERPTT